MMFSSRRATFVLSFLCLGVAVWSQGYPPPYNTKTYEHPSYTVVESNKDFEIRSYAEAQWVSTNISAPSYKKGAYEGFTRLFSYYFGNNKQHVRINMTVPVLVNVDNSTYTVNFYLPEKYQKDALPEPLSSDVVPVKLPKRKYVAVRRYGGFISEINIRDELLALKNALKGTKYDKAAKLEQYTVVGYNSPFELFNRVNEIFIWFD